MQGHPTRDICANIHIQFVFGLQQLAASTWYHHYHVESARNVIGHVGLLMFSPVEIVRTTLGKLKKGTLTFCSSKTNYLALYLFCYDLSLLTLAALPLIIILMMFNSWSETHFEKVSKQLKGLSPKTSLHFVFHDNVSRINLPTPIKIKKLH